MTRHRFTCVSIVTLLVALLLAVEDSSLVTVQQPTGQSPPAPIVPYRTPAIALVQPPERGTVPQDRPVVVFRFAPGEATDPLDVTTFRVAVDGVDQSARFQVAVSEAWGAIGPAPSGEAAVEGIAAGLHQVVARICSSRGACAEASAAVTVVPGAMPAPTANAREAEKNGGRRERVIDALLSAVKKLLSP